MSDGEIRADFLNSTQVIATQSKDVTNQDKYMKAQANQEVAPRVNQYVSTMASRLGDFTRMTLHCSLVLRLMNIPKTF